MEKQSTILQSIPSAMTEQEVFDHVARHLLTQREPAAARPSISGEGGLTCLYRGRSWLNESVITACAAGCLIPDDVYSPKMEHKDISVVVEQCADLEFLRPHLGILTLLQALHDNEGAEHWASGLRCTAGGWGVSPRIVDEMERAAAT